MTNEGLEQVELIGECIVSFPMDGIFGRSYLNKFIDDDGTIYIWITDKNFISKNKYKIVGKLKGFKEYNYEQQVVLTRCKAEELKDECEAETMAQRE